MATVTIDEAEYARLLKCRDLSVEYGAKIRDLEFTLHNGVHLGELVAKRNALFSELEELRSELDKVRGPHGPTVELIIEAIRSL